MAGVFARIRNKIARKSALRFWSGALDRIEQTPKSRLRPLAMEAQRLGKTLARFEHRAQDRLRTKASPPLMNGATWAERVDLFAEPISPLGHAPLQNAAQISQSVTAFTDDPHAQVGFRQITAPDGTYQAIFDVHHLGGSFLSLAIGLGETVAKSLSKDDLLRLRLTCESEQEVEMLVRLNLRSGPNTEQSIRKLQPGRDVEFDLFYVDFEPERMSDAWIDFMLPPHQMNRIVISDMVISKLPRAEI